MGISNRYLINLINMPLLDAYLLEYKKNNISIQYLIKEYCKNRTFYDTKIL